MTTMRKEVDDRIRILIENGVKSRHRSFFVIIGDKPHDQIVNLRYLCEKVGNNSIHRILWCYKEKLELSSHNKKRKKQMKRVLQSGMLDPEKADHFLLFVETAKITYCMYKESERILGNTFSMCILQDFEALTPNILARTIETVEGGGLILLLIRSLPRLTSLYTMIMDVHLRFRTEAHFEDAPHFNERFLLSLASCKACVVADDELNILPISSHMRSIDPVTVNKDTEGLSEAERCLKDLKEQLNDHFPAGPLIKVCSTWGQGRALMILLDAILYKSLKSTVSLLAARGRGKSAALGLAVAGAVAAGYPNIFVTAPSPENLKTLFEFVCTGLSVLEYKEHIDYAVVGSANPQFKKTTIQINICKAQGHRQSIQYIQPQEHERLSQVDLLIIDEAAAIPLPIVKSLLGPYLVFFSSTVNGYEGTGRSLSLKLLQQLEDQSHMPEKNNNCLLTGRSFKKVELNDSIRYATGDPMEEWLNSLLCLDVTNSIPQIHRLPLPNECDLYYVNRDTLFSFHKESELFLKRMMALFVASHYKNSPNDLQLLADAPAHHLFVLLGPVDESKNHLPDILCVMQICLEGKISRESAVRSLSEGRQPFGDQIPWKFCEQYQDTIFPSLLGARIVRIATHPNAMKFGYGSKAVELLVRYYKGQLTAISKVGEFTVEKTRARSIDTLEKVSLLEENIGPRAELPPLLVHLCDRKPETLNYIGVSFGLTLDLFRFWRKQNFVAFYICQIPNNVTGEHTCMVLRELNTDDAEVSRSKEQGSFSTFYEEFRHIFLNLLISSFSRMEYKLAMSVLDPKISFTETESTSSLSIEFLRTLFEPIRFMEKLKAYVNNGADFLSIRDIELHLALLYFKGRIPVALSYAQASVLLCKCLQQKDLSFIVKEMKLERSQILSLFMKIMKKFYKYLHGLRPALVVPSPPKQKNFSLCPHNLSGGRP